MVKTYGKCKLCNSEKFLNFAGLCKKCNKTDKSSNIKEELAKKQHEVLKTQKEKKIEKTVKNIEKQALKVKENLSIEQKKRLVELTPGIETIVELEEEREKKKDETDSEKKDDEKDSK